MRRSYGFLGRREYEQGPDEDVGRHRRFQDLNMRTGREIVLVSLATLGGLFNVRDAHAVPSFARQMQVACSVCHTQFPELNAFGREFKLRGYTLDSGEQIQAQDEEQRTLLSLGRLPPVSMMLQAAYTQTRGSIPETQNGDFQLPQQMSLFLAGKITPKIGSFLQVTYTQADDKFGIDNAEFRFADSTKLFGKPTDYGVTLNNAPGVEDLWNTMPVWGFPWAAPDVAPEPAAATLIDGQLGQDVAGVGGFLFWDSKIYAATTLYRSAHLGQDVPTLGSENTIDSVAPYWRVAWQRARGSNNLEVGAYGISAALIPEGTSGPTDDYRDVAVDFQYDTLLRGHQLGFHGSLTRERRDLHASFATGNAEHESSDLATLRLDGSYYRDNWRFTLGLFSTNGDSDALLYAPGQVDGSVSGNPDSRGYILQASHAPWQNVQLMLQYTGYARFNGGKSNYDGFGRDAADNNALLLHAWFNW
jgi:hypothetical protein